MVVGVIGWCVLLYDDGLDYYDENDLYDGWNKKIEYDTKFICWMVFSSIS